MRRRPSPQPAPFPFAPLARLLPAALLLLLPSACRASEPPPPPVVTDAPAAPVPASLTHWPAPAPAPIRADDPVLWVALAARLGPATPAEAAAAPPLILRAASGRLTLVDGAGQRFTAPQLVLHWRRESLSAPVLLLRQVQGPFGSFESAERAASRWRELGVAAEIARPRDWEVWAPPGAPVPAGVTTRSFERTETARLGLEVRRPAGSQALKGPLRIEAPGGLLWKEGVYPGPFLLQADAHGSWTLVEQVPLERYLEGVVPHEIGAGAPAAALAAQTILARTWALRNQHRFLVDGYHLCADTQCQVYSDPRQAGTAVRQAIAATRLQVLAWQGQPIHAVYHATNGGVTAGFEEVWSGDPLPYLQAAVDGPEAFQARFPLPLTPPSLEALLRESRGAWGGDHPLFRWRRSLTAEQIVRALGPDARGLGTPRRLEVLERGPSGRVLSLKIVGSSGSLVLQRDAIRRTLRQLPSTLFRVVGAGPGRWGIEGGGFGHGAGLSQAGAIELARRGWSSQRILSHYYPGTEIQPLRGPGEAP